MISTVRSTIIVPTCNRETSLKNLLASLDSMEYPNSGAVEVLVVANGCTDGTASFLLEEQGRAHRFSLKMLQESQRGKARALNLGLDSAAADIILIVDDDVVVHPRWLDRHLECFETTSFDAVQGRVLPGTDAEGRIAEPDKLHEYNIPIVDYGAAICQIRGWTGANVSFRRQVFERIGYFDPRLGPGASGFSEDTEYSMRMRQAGFTIGYSPFAIVFHELDPRRYGRAYNRAVHYRKGYSRSLYRKRSIAFHVLPNLLVNCIRFGFYGALGKCAEAYRTEGKILRYWGFLIGRAKRSIGRRS